MAKEINRESENKLIDGCGRNKEYFFPALKLTFCPY